MAGKVYLVGIGTGNPIDLTPRAEKALVAVKVVIGNGLGLEYTRRLLPGKEVLGQKMSPLERSQAAVEYCQKGYSVAIISTGDPGIYAIASTFLNYLKDRGILIPVEIIPGVTTSSNAAASLGAPIGNDFAVMSLSDQAGHWPASIKRIVQAAALDFVLVLYNPVGKLGNERILEACKALEPLKDPQTPVGIVSSAGGDDESVQIISLKMLPLTKLSIDSLIIIGNSATFVYDTWMITPRAYQPGLGY
ncbi:MAG: precorrin-3B C(17)-methyltransferase [Dehalococcoidales bacterium]|nr:precorrin-3B C(17)-methyltransferase [Dehalococcoidales bacterium]